MYVDVYVYVYVYAYAYAYVYVYVYGGLTGKRVNRELLVFGRRNKQQQRIEHTD